MRLSFGYYWLSRVVIVAVTLCLLAFRVVAYCFCTMMIALGLACLVA